MKKYESFKKIYESLLKRNVRQAKSILIDVEKKEKGFVSKIKILSKGQVFWASKSAGSINESLRRTTQAITKQVDKSYGRRVHRLNINDAIHSYHELSDAA